MGLGSWKTYTGSRGQKGTGFQIRNTAGCCQLRLFSCNTKFKYFFGCRNLNFYRVGGSRDRTRHCRIISQSSYNPSPSEATSHSQMQTLYRGSSCIMKITVLRNTFKNKVTWYCQCLCNYLQIFLLKKTLPHLYNKFFTIYTPYFCATNSKLL